MWHLSVKKNQRIKGLLKGFDDASCEFQILLMSFEEIGRKESFHIYRSVAYLLTADLPAHKWEQKGGQGTERWAGWQHAITTRADRPTLAWDTLIGQQ